ncbi:MAG: signal peptidase II [Bacteroidetes bacterium]|nr:signal peptidase II [Bacteroidota bacterium]MCB0843653.1 signal peptidase II [Bacteroidota bacterium]
MSKKVQRIIMILLLVGLNVVADQVSKKIARSNLNYDERIEVVGDYFILLMVENEGAFLSLGDELPEVMRKILLIILPSIILLFLMFSIMVRADMQRGFMIGVCFIIGGGIGNMIDRIIHGSVTDFLNIGIENLRTGIFNFADMSISAGFIIILVGYVMELNRNRKLKQEQKAVQQENQDAPVNDTPSISPEEENTKSEE